MRSGKNVIPCGDESPLKPERAGDNSLPSRVLANLGREDKLDATVLRRLVASINRYLGDEDLVILPLGAEAGLPAAEQACPCGTIWLLDELGHAESRQGAGEGAGQHRFRTDIGRILFALVVSRAVAPSCKLAAAERVTHIVAVRGLERADKDRAM